MLEKSADLNDMNFELNDEDGHNSRTNKDMTE